jgi:nucleoid DNA-binding protein
MTKANIIELIAEKTGFTIVDVRLIVKKFLQETKNYLAKDKSLGIRGFGTFKMRNGKARKAWNPETGEEVMVPARKKVVLKVSSELNRLLK